MHFRGICLLVVLLLSAAAAPASGSAKPWIGVSGNHLVNRAGRPVRLLGVNRAGPEYRCVEDQSIFEGPTDAASIEAMKRWPINAVRVPLNESCWLGINGLGPSLSGAVYRNAVAGFVKRLERAGLYVILDLQWAAPGTYLATGLIPLPDAEHAPAFWLSVAGTFRHDRSLLFDLYNEPHDVSWECWAAPCTVHDNWFGDYPATGLPQLLEVVRSTGARQPVMLGGLDWSRDLGGWLEHVPADPAHAIVASNHTYNFSACYSSCRAALARIASTYPVVTGELGEGDCRHGYIDSYMRWADRHGISYLGWAWDTGVGWSCKAGPSLITNYAGHPTRFGAGLRRHLRAIRPLSGAAARGSAAARPGH
ncbi:MAG: cellulase family glycosylhydrolase [Solirubrobacterales bacterium]